jgi:dTDP-4-dehydrorhamnose reductase
MAVDQLPSPTIALLGGGYTLQRVAQMLPAGSFVITSRDSDRCAAWQQRGWLSQCVSLENPESIAELFKRFPELETLVDSVPPVRHGVPTSGVKALVSVLQTTKVRRILYLSTTGVFGVRDGSVVDEDTPPSPWNSQGAARLACEECYRNLVRERVEVSFTALRLPAIYGEDRGVAFSLREGAYTLIDDGSYWTNRIHVHDLASVIVACVKFSGTLPGVLCVSDDYPTKAIDVVSYICERERLPLPRSITAHEAAQAGAYTMLSNQRICNERMKALLGVILRYPSFREGIYGESRGGV